MPRDLRITTPENVQISYDLAGPGSRSLAFAIDSFCQTFILLVFAILAARISLQSDSGLHIWMAKWAQAMFGIIAFLVYWGYFFYFEAYKDGQTPGKKFYGLRVVRDNGMPLDVTAAAIRNLVRVIDFLPVLYMAGAWSMLISPESKRLGDYAAGTLVIKERVGETPNIGKSVTTIEEPQTRLIPDISPITSEDYRIVKRFIERQHELGPEVSEQLAGKIAAPLIEKLGINPVEIPGFNNSVFLTEVYIRSQQEKGFL